MWEEQDIEEVEELRDLACVPVEKQVIGHPSPKRYRTRDHTENYSKNAQRGRINQGFSALTRE